MPAVPAAAARAAISQPSVPTLAILAGRETSMCNKYSEYCPRAGLTGNSALHQHFSV